MPGKFKWVAPDQDELDSINRHQREQKGGLFDGIIKSTFNTYKTKTGENKIRILPPTFGNRKYFALPVFMHFSVGPDNAAYLCEEKMFNEECACCEERVRLQQMGDTEAAKKLRPSQQYVTWVIDRSAEGETEPQVFRYGFKMAASIATVSVDSDTGRTLTIFHPDAGYDLSFRKEEKGGGAMNVDYYGHTISRRESPVHKNPKVQERWLDFITDNPLDTVLQRYDYEHIAKCFRGKAPTVTEDLGGDEDDDPPPRTSRGSVRDEIDDEIPEHAGGNRAGEMSDIPHGSHAGETETDPEDDEDPDDPPFDKETGEIKETPRGRTPERVREDVETANSRQRPRLNTAERERPVPRSDVRNTASAAVARLRERAGRDR